MPTLRQQIAASGPRPERRLWDIDGSVAVDGLLGGGCLGARVAGLSGRSVLVAVAGQLAAALAVVELDGVARRLVLCPPGLPPDQVAAVAAVAEADAIVSDLRPDQLGGIGATLFVPHDRPVRRADDQPVGGFETEWVLLTSGTTGLPKLVAHTLGSLTGAIQPGGAAPPVWSTFYDIRRFGGLQVLLRALIGGGSLVLSFAGEPAGAFLARSASHGVTHILGTPSHWRRALMAAPVPDFAPSYVRLSGEIADQAVLDGLRARFPAALVAHAFASTEAGVGFEVRDGLTGFPASLLDRPGEVEMTLADGSLRLRSARTARRYLGDHGPLADAHGFVDTGDMVERHGDRCRFVGRRGGIINVGGLKVHPEEVEGVINRHPEVRMSRVSARRNPITGAIVVAEVLAREPASEGPGAERLKREITLACREALAAHKVPASIRLVAAIEVAASGKLARPVA